MTISDRMKKLIDAWIPQRGRFKKLEERSNIPYDHWKNFWHGKQRANEYMIASIARMWPEYALWLTTGIDDSEFGQIRLSSDQINEEIRSLSAQIFLRKVQIQDLYESPELIDFVNNPLVSSVNPDKAMKEISENFLGALADMESKGIPLPDNLDDFFPIWTDVVQQAMEKDGVLRQLINERMALYKEKTNRNKNGD
ncbi:hypothetical protein [Undibacterium curvum]|uniref:hypothetical protein n=1 Tax=Undibacterium curvum TaxID=2762294 RepID=UPI003D13AB64